MNPIEYEQAASEDEESDEPLEGEIYDEVVKDISLDDIDTDVRNKHIEQAVEGDFIRYDDAEDVDIYVEETRGEDVD